MTPLPSLADELGHAWLGVKRDDLCADLRGGSKVRKLDFLLAAPRYAEVQQWTSLGATGSGHLASLALAAEVLGRDLHAHCFWEDLGPGVLDNLACTTSHSVTLRSYGSRTAAVAHRPGLILGTRSAGIPVIPPGATAAAGILGLVRAGLELADQVSAGELPEPDLLYVPWGTGGTAVGLALGLGLAGLKTEVRAVATVEHLLALRSRLRRLLQTTRELLDLGPEGPAAAPLHIVHGFVGSGYGKSTEASCRWSQRLTELGLGLEPIYGGKAFAALAEEATTPRRVLYWLTSHRGDLPHAPDWRNRLPPSLARRIADAETRSSSPESRGWTRRRVVATGVGLGVAVAVPWRLTGHRGLEDWQGAVFARWEAVVILAAARAVLPDDPNAPPDSRLSEVPARIDRYLRGAPPEMLLEVHGMMVLLDQGTLLNGQLTRLTRLTPAAGRSFLERLTAIGGLLAVAARGIRDLVYLGWYQAPHTWPALGYDGPWVKPRTPASGRYDTLVAADGDLPRGVVR